MKKLVTWFSAGGVTAKKAKALAKAADADLHEIVPKEKYTGADRDWTNKSSRSSRENADPASRPALAEEKTDLSAYDVIYIGFPIWWGVAPRIINTFIESNDLAGKKIVLFATSGGTGISMAKDALQKTYPDLDIEAAALVNGAVAKDLI